MFTCNICPCTYPNFERVTKKLLECSRMYAECMQNVPECMHNVKECYAECMQNVCRMFQNVPESILYLCMEFPHSLTHCVPP